MQTESVKNFFMDLIKIPPALQQGNQLILDKIRARPDFILDVIQYLSSQQQFTSQIYKQCFHIITLIHPSIIQIFSQLQEKIQEDIRGGLMNCVISLYEDLKCVAGLGLLIREIVQIDSLEPWLEPFTQLLKWISSDDVAIVQAGIEFFIYILKQTRYNKSNCDLPLYKMAGPLLQVLYQLFANSQLSQIIREKLLYLVLQLIKTFSIHDGYQDNIVKQAFDPTYEIWMSFFVSTLQTTVYSNIRIKKYIMKIIVIIFRDLQKYLSEKQKDQPYHLYVIWEFCYKFLPLHLWVNVWQKDVDKFINKDNFSKEEDLLKKNNLELFVYYDEDNEALLNQIESLALIVLEFISVLTSIPQLNTSIKISIHHLANFLFHFMMMSEYDVLFWRNNIQQFLTTNVISDYEVTVRSKVLSILNQLIEKCGDYAIQAILFISEKFLLNLPESKTTESVKEILQNFIEIKNLPELSSNIYDSNQKFFNLLKLSSIDVRTTLHVSGQTWKKMEVALGVLGRFAQDIIVFQSKQQGAFDIESFVKGLIKQVKDEEFYELLKGQSLYCLTRFTEIISIKYKNLFIQLTITCFSCIRNSKSLSVKLIACRALTLFLRKIDRNKLQYSQQDMMLIRQTNILQSLMAIPLSSEITNVVLESLIEVFKNNQIGPTLVSEEKTKIYPEYLLSVFHKNINHTSTIQLFFSLLEEICKIYEQYQDIVSIFVKFIEQCLKSYCSILESVEQMRHLKNSDLDLILVVLKINNVLIMRGYEMCLNEKPEILKQRSQYFLSLIPVYSNIIKLNTDIQIQIQVTICMKNLVKLASFEIKSKPELVSLVIQSIKNLLKIPKDKSFQTASVFVGNLTILAFSKLFTKNNYQILQQAVLKVFRSRTPSVIQSLVLVYARLININTNLNNPFELNMKNQITDLVDFLSSFSIENRMGLKILIDKWLLQQSLFRGKFTKISTFMALSKFFLLGDKRIDNLLVIGFNPSHTNVSNDVTAPLKILATLIRCLDNEKRFEKGNQDQEENNDSDTQFKQQQKTVEVTLQKFKEQKNYQDENQESQQGGLADRENQQGSTCYMSAMLEFYDDGEECDQTTEEDLIFLEDPSTGLVLGDYLIQFFNYLIQTKKQYFKECLKGILRQDVKTLQKYVKLD